MVFCTNPPRAHRDAYFAFLCGSLSRVRVNKLLNTARIGEEPWRNLSADRSLKGISGKGAKAAKGEGVDHCLKFEENSPIGQGLSEPSGISTGEDL